MNRVAWLIKTLQALGSTRVAVGWHDTARYPDGMPVAEVAYVHEFGDLSERIPPRPMMRPVIAAQQSAWSQLMGEKIKAVIDGKITAEQALIFMGELAAGQIREQITKIDEPPLKEATIKERQRKGYQPDKPLVRTKHLLATVTSELVNRDYR